MSSGSIGSPMVPQRSGGRRSSSKCLLTAAHVLPDTVPGLRTTFVSAEAYQPAVCDLDLHDSTHWRSFALRLPRLRNRTRIRVRFRIRFRLRLPLQFRLSWRPTHTHTHKAAVTLLVCKRTFRN